MKFFTVYDMILQKALEMGMKEKEIYSYLKKEGISKKELQEMKVSATIPGNGELHSIVLKFLGMTELELNLCLGKLPIEFRNSYIKNAEKIADLLQNDTPKPAKSPTVHTNVHPYFTTKYGRLYKGDCLRLFRRVPANSIDCIFADPPFNLDKEYGSKINDSKSPSDYINWCYHWLNECVRVIKPGGSLFIYNLPRWHTYFAHYLNQQLNFFSWISVDMKFSLPIPRRLYPSHYSLLYYTKGLRPQTFNPQRIPLKTCRFCAGETSDYGGYKDKMNPNGVNLSDVWSDIYPVRHNTQKNRKFNELSIKLLDRVISMSTNKGDTVLDPFGGSGTTYAVCELLRRKWIGFELGDCSSIKRRLFQPEKDKRLLEKIYTEKHVLFPPSVKQLRRRNRHWLPEDFHSHKRKNSKPRIEE